MGLVQRLQRTAVKQRPHQETGRQQAATSEPVVLHHGREGRRCRSRRGAADCCNGLLGGARNPGHSAFDRSSHAVERTAIAPDGLKMVPAAEGTHRNSGMHTNRDFVHGSPGLSGTKESRNLLSRSVGGEGHWRTGLSGLSPVPATGRPSTLQTGDTTVGRSDFEKRPSLGGFGMKRPSNLAGASSRLRVGFSADGNLRRIRRAAWPRSARC
jgi:hypothetical protein